MMIDNMRAINNGRAKENASDRICQFVTRTFLAEALTVTRRKPRTLLLLTVAKSVVWSGFVDAESQGGGT